MAKRTMGTIVVAGDVCLDVVGIPVPPSTRSDGAADNWRQTGETRTYYLPGGSLLLEQWVKAATSNWTVKGVVPCLPQALACGVEGDHPLSIEKFIEFAERVTRNEVVHSLMELDLYPCIPKSKDESDRRIRVRAKHGFSGPEKNEPELKLLPSQETQPRIIVLDDTGNRFRRSRDQWPVAVLKKDPNAIVVYKLHRPLPPVLNSETVGAVPSHDQRDDLWREVAAKFRSQRIVIVSVDDLRALDVSISCGLSWERTALDVVWQLRMNNQFAELRQSPHLIVRLGLDGAIYWRNNLAIPSSDEASKAAAIDEKTEYEAWLIYDPAGIEGTGANQYEGEMVGYGSAFTAGFVGCLARTCEQPEETAHQFLRRDDQGQPLLVQGIVAGLNAARRLLGLGYGAKKQTPAYPMSELFSTSTPELKDSRKCFTIKDSYFACSVIPFSPSAHAPDVGYWRLLDTIFYGKKSLLHKAVELVATGVKPNDKAADPDERTAVNLLKQVPIAVFAKALRAYDRHEIENYRGLHSLMLEYICKANPLRPLSVAVFGPPGAGKSFGVKQVAKALGELGGPRPIETLTFNLSQYQTPEQLARAFQLVRDLVLQGKIPLVFFDEFDAMLAGNKIGWLRYFLAPMQDAEFLDQGTPHPIGQAIFVFAGGTCSSYAEFAKPFFDPESDVSREAFKSSKGPDFLSRLRGRLDIPGLDLDTNFDAYGPMEEYPCEAAILLRRAGIFAHQLGEKAPHMRDANGALQVSWAVLRAMLHLPKFVHGNRSFEALLDMSHLSGEKRLIPSILPSASHVSLHANPTHLGQLVTTDYPFPPGDRVLIAKNIHRSHLENSTKKNMTNDEAWKLASPGDMESSLHHADAIASKLRSIGLWFRKLSTGDQIDSKAIAQLEEKSEVLAIQEHDRWVASQRREGWIATSGPNNKKDPVGRLHNCLFRWEELSDKQKEYDRVLVKGIPDHLKAAGYEIFMPETH